MTGHPSLPDPAPGSERSAKKKVLIVSHEAEASFVLASAFHGLDIEPLHTSTTRELLDVFSENVLAVFIDFPLSNGDRNEDSLAVIAAIRRSPWASSLPILLSSNSQNKHFLSCVYAFPLVEILPYPVPPVMLQARLSALLESAKNAELVRSQAQEIENLGRSLQSQVEKIDSAVQACADEFSTLLQNVPDIISRFDRDFRFLYASPAAERAMSLRAQDLLGRTHLEIGLPESTANFLHESLQKVFQTARPETIEFNGGRPDGPIRRYLAVGIPEFDASGEVKSVLTVARDVTAQKNSEDAQLEVESQLLLLVEASGTLLSSPESEEVLNSILNLANRFVKADAHAVWRFDKHSDAWRMIAMQGLSEHYARYLSGEVVRATCVPQQPLAVDDIETVPWAGARLNAYREEGIRSLLSVPLNIHGENGGTIVFYYRSSHVFSDIEIRIAAALGNLAAAALGAAELYERQKSLRELAESAERRAAFLAKVGDVLASSLDYETTLRSLAELAVPFFADWCAIDILEKSGQRLDLIVKHMDPRKMRLGAEYRKYFPFHRALEAGHLVWKDSITLAELEAHIKDERQLQMLRELGPRSYIQAPMTTRGRTLGILTFVTAESGRHYNLADTSLAEDLARRAATAIDNVLLLQETTASEQRLRVLIEREKSANDLLQSTNNALRRANADLEQFAYSASHDLQEPLRMVAIYTQLLKSRYHSKLDEKADLFIEYAVQGAKRMEALVKDLLIYTQSASLAEDEPVTPVAVEIALEKALQNLDTAMQESGAYVRVQPLPPVSVHQVHLQQLFQNLLSNALKYRSEKVPEIEIFAVPQQDQWLFCVKDNGIGIDAQYLKQIFGVFRRLHGAAEYPGTGIGLAICQKIVERYRGTIWAESQLGSGSSFYFTLPT